MTDDSTHEPPPTAAGTSPTPSAPSALSGLNPLGLLAAAAMATEAEGDDGVGGESRRPLRLDELPTREQLATAFPDLEIGECIGQGGMSVVYQARQPQLRRVVALKVMPRALAAVSGFVERFTREAQVLARLTHPGIVAVYDFGQSGGFCFLSMEYVEGVNLRQAMRAGRFTPEQALQVIPGLCQALQFAHSHGVLHRDIKPENILLDKEGRVKIADFGIAKILDDEPADSRMLTQSGARLGTAPYMAPEQIEQPSSVDHRADIYSLGVVFYEMLTGELPLGRFAAPSEKAAVGAGMDEVVFRSLQKERTRRQQSVGEFQTQVQGAAAGEPGSTTGPAMGPAGPIMAQHYDFFEYKSARTLWGLPLIHVLHGRDPVTRQKRWAHGVIAVGDMARGVFAMGGIAYGGVAVGGLAAGVVAFGGLGIGLVALAGLAVGGVAIGGVAAGLLAAGGVGIGWCVHGGVAVGWYGYGGVVAAEYGMGGKVEATHVVKSLKDMPWPMHFLAKVLKWSALLGFAWIPAAVLPSMIVQWARKQKAK